MATRRRQRAYLLTPTLFVPRFPGFTALKDHFNIPLLLFLFPLLKGFILRGVILRGERPSGGTTVLFRGHSCSRRLRLLRSSLPHAQHHIRSCRSTNNDFQVD